MRYFRSAALAAVAVIGFASVGFAADMPLKAAPIAPAPVYSWAGCYLGVNGGYGWQHSHSPDVTINPGPLLFPSTGSLDPHGGFGGGQVGCNYQAGKFVYGFEADFDGAGVRSSYGPTLFTTPAVLTVSGSQNLNWFGTLRGRLGWAVDRALLYVTGGLAYGHTKYNVFAFDTGGNTVTMNGDTSRAGLALGGGVEWALSGPWTIKAEYQYINLGTIGPITGVALNPAGVPTGSTTTTQSFRNDYHTVRVGLNYRFWSAH